MRKFYLFLALLFAMTGGTQVKAGTTVSFASLGDYIKTSAGLVDGAKVVMHSVGRAGYLYENTSDNKLYKSTAAPTAGVDGMKFVMTLVASGTNFMLKTNSGAYFSKTGSQITTTTDATAAAVYTIFQGGTGGKNGSWLLKRTDAATYLNGETGYPSYWNGTGENSQYEIIATNLSSVTTYAATINYATSVFH